VLAVEDLDLAVTYFTEHVHLRPTHRDDDRVFLTGGGEHHWIVLEQADGRIPGVARIAFEVNESADLDAAQRRLEAAGFATAFVEDRAVARALDFADPDGLPIRLYWGMDYDAAPKRPAWVNIAELLHVGLSVSNAVRSAGFYRELLGFVLSDWVGNRGAFLRTSNGFHHALVLLERGDPRLEHICFQMQSFDDLMRARAILLADQKELEADLIRHAPSNSVGLYVHGVPPEVRVEFCIWHDKLDDEWHPRVLTASPWAYNQWTPPKDRSSWR